MLVFQQAPGMEENSATLTRNFLVEDDDLVDELLSAMKDRGWSNLKMEYQLGKLAASKQSGRETIWLTVEWKEFDEEMQLRMAVIGELADADLQKECLGLMDSLFAQEVYRRVNENN